LAFNEGLQLPNLLANNLLKVYLKRESFFLAIQKHVTGGALNSEMSKVEQTSGETAI
jgi:hypothetical protein